MSASQTLLKYLETVEALEKEKEKAPAGGVGPSLDKMSPRDVLEVLGLHGVLEKIRFGRKKKASKADPAQGTGGAGGSGTSSTGGPSASDNNAGGNDTPERRDPVTTNPGGGNDGNGNDGNGNDGNGNGNGNACGMGQEHAERCHAELRRLQAESTAHGTQLQAHAGRLTALENNAAAAANQNSNNNQQQQQPATEEQRNALANMQGDIGRMQADITQVRATVADQGVAITEANRRGVDIGPLPGRPGLEQGGTAPTTAGGRTVQTVRGPGGDRTWSNDPWLNRYLERGWRVFWALVAGIIFGSIIFSSASPRVVFCSSSGESPSQGALPLVISLVVVPDVC
ncbi:hypothetical protein PG994_003194 [Apiospora phragmitis]|uniref:Uncharacterized protein n=1 Tax=Apiospora phragmitis TaxID=2905665 RepID=A0ABR1VYL1_9PEZI